MSAEEQSPSCCPVIDLMRDYFPLVPLVVPILFPLLPMVCIIMYAARISDALGRIEETLDDIRAAVRRIG